MNFLRGSAIFVFFALAAVQAVTSTRPDDYVEGEKELDFNSQVLLKAIKKRGDKLMDHIELLQSQIKSLEQKYMTEENKILKNKMNSLENENKYLNENIQEVINLPCGQIDRNGTANIWEALLTRSLAGVKYWYTLDPASITRKNEHYYNNTPLHDASDKGHLEIVQFLLSKGVDVDALDSNNNTPLMFASLGGHVSVVKALLDKGAKINHQNEDKQTPLHCALLGNSFPVMQVLIERGADQSLRDIRYRTPLDWARILRFSSIEEYLTSH